MRFQLSMALVALLPTGLCNPFHGKHNALVPDAMAARAAEPLDVVPRANSGENPFFMVTSFCAYIPRPGSPSDWSGANFKVRYMHPQEAQRWTAMCTTLVNNTLCDGQSWHSCTLPRGMDPKETLKFRMGGNMQTVDLKWHWPYNGQWFDTMSTQSAHWVPKAYEQDPNGNMTINPETISYTKPEGWVFTWSSMVG